MSLSYPEAGTTKLPNLQCVVCHNWWWFFLLQLRESRIQGESIHVYNNPFGFCKVVTLGCLYLVYSAVLKCSPQSLLFTPLLPFTRPLLEAHVCTQDLHLKEKYNIWLQNQMFSENIARLAPETQFLPLFCQTALKSGRISIFKSIFCLYFPTF